MEYTVHRSDCQLATVFIKGNGIVSQYKVEDDTVYKIVQIDGEDELEYFHTFGDVCVNSEAALLKQLRDKGEI